MPLIIQETEKDLDKKLNVSDPYGSLSDELVAAYASIQQDKENGLASGQNIKRIEGLAKQALGYDKEDDPSKTSIHMKSEQPRQSINITKGQVKKTLHDIAQIPQDQRGKYAPLVNKINGVFANALKGNRNANKITSKFKPDNLQPKKPKTVNDKSVKPLNDKNGTQIHIINENIDDSHPFYDYLEEYSHYNIFGWFEMDKRDNNGKNTIWFPRINPNEYQQALDYLSKFGELPKPLQQKPYQWFGIIMKNTAILANCTDLCGHSSYFPKDDFLCYFFSDDENGEWEEWLNEKGVEDDEFYSCEEYLNEIGFYDWCILPDGSDAMSDYGLQPLLQIIKEYNDNLNPEQVLVLVNKALDIYHCRGDLSSIFIVGGTKSLTQISNSHLSENKKIVLTEKQLEILNEHIRQLHIPFEEFGGDERGKVPYEYYMDFIESIGKYGTLEPSCFQIQDFTRICNEIIPDLVSQYRNIFDDSIYDFVEENLEYHPEYFVNPQDVDFNYIDVDELNEKGAYALFKDYYERPDNFIKYLTLNNKNQVYIERIISIDFDPLKYKGTKNKDFDGYYSVYRNLEQRFDNVGYHWSWMLGGADDFYHNPDFARQKNNLVLKGWVKLEDVDWEKTFINNYFEFPEEHELSIQDGAIVQIDEIIWHETGQKLPLKQPILVKA